MTNLIKLKAETQESFEKADARSLKVLIFITKVLKNLYTKEAIFIASLVMPLVTSIFIYMSNGKPSIFVICGIVHLVSYYLLLKYSFNDMDDTYREQKCVQETLEEMLKNK